MTNDPYAPCPCGSGKKLKWCCHDLLDDMRRIERFIEQNQTAAALTALDRLAEKWPNNPWVTTTQAKLFWRDDQHDQASRAIDRLLQAHPGHPGGLVLRALERMESEGPKPGLEPVQAAIAAAGDSEELAQLALAVGVTLEEQGEPFAARAHLRLARRLHPDHERIAQFVASAEQQSDIPDVLRDEYHLKQADLNGAEHRATFTEAAALSERGAWLQAADRFASLEPHVPDCKELHYNLGLCRAWVLETEQAVAALRRYEELESDRDAAVEIEALAQMLDEPPWGKPLDLLVVTYPLRGRDALLRAADASEQCEPMATGAEDEDPDQAPSAYLLLDRPAGQWREGIGPGELAKRLGMFAIEQGDADGGGQVVRFSAARDEGLDQARELFQRVAGDSVGEPEPEETVTGAGGEPHPVQIRWEFPDGTSRQECLRLVHLEQTRYLEQGWPDRALARCDGKTPPEAAQDPQCHVALSAMVMLLGQRFLWDALAAPLQQIRQRLGLTPAEPLSVDEAAIEELPLARLGRIAAGPLGDTALASAARRAARFGALPTLLRLGDEMLRRDSLLKRIDLGMLCAELSKAAHTLYDTESALRYNNQARELDARYERNLCAFWDLQELPLRLFVPDPAKAQSLLQHIVEQHRDASVQRALGQILASFGLLSEGEPEAEQEPAIVVPGGTQPGRIWTPNQDEPRRAAPKIWTPGDA